MAYSVFAYWIVLGEDCIANEICEALHDINIVLMFFKWTAIYIPYKIICALLLYRFTFLEQIETTDYLFFDVEHSDGYGGDEEEIQPFLQVATVWLFISNLFQWSDISFVDWIYTLFT